MIRRSSAALVALVLMLVGAVGLAGVPSARAQQAPDKSDVVILLDFSASILQDKANRQRFGDGAGPDRRPGRRDLAGPRGGRRDAVARPVRGPRHATIPAAPTSRPWARRGTWRSSRTACAAWPGPTARASTRTSASGSASTRTTWPRWSRRLRHLPEDSVRPAAILLTDGKHDVAGVPGQPGPSRARPPVRRPLAVRAAAGGHGPRRRSERGQLKRGLDALQDHPGHAGVRQRRDVRLAADRRSTPRPRRATRWRVALQNVTCTFTGRAHAHAAPDADADARAAAGPGPEHRGGRGKRRDPAHLAGARRRTGRRRRLRRPLPHGPGRAGSNPTEGTSTTTNAAITGVDNGAPYECQVAAIGSASPRRPVHGGLRHRHAHRPAVGAGQADRVGLRRRCPGGRGRVTRPGRRGVPRTSAPATAARRGRSRSRAMRRIRPPR